MEWWRYPTGLLWDDVRWTQCYLASTLMFSIRARNISICMHVEKPESSYLPSCNFPFQTRCALSWPNSKARGEWDPWRRSRVWLVTWFLDPMSFLPFGLVGSQPDKGGPASFLCLHALTCSSPVPCEWGKDLVDVKNWPCVELGYPLRLDPQPCALPPPCHWRMMAFILPLRFLGNVFGRSKCKSKISPSFLIVHIGMFPQCLRAGEGGDRAESFIK